MDTSPTESYAPIKIEMQPEYVDTPMNNVVTEPTKRRKQRSIIWEDFTLKDVGDGETRAVCMTCTEDFAYIKGSKHVGTSHLKRHLESHKRLSKVSVDSAGLIKQTPKRRSKTASVPVASDSAEKGGLGVSSLYALNRALMCKWVWRFTTQKNLLWTRVIKAIHGEDGKNGSGFKVGYKSIWRSILQEVETLKIKGIHLNNFMQKKLGNGADTYFWEDLWHGDMVLKQRYPRLYALEVKKTVDVASKLSQENLTWSFRRAPRSGVEQDQLTDLTTYVEGVVLGVTPDRWYWTLDGSGEFSVASARKVIDDNRFPEVSTQTRWIKAVPIKVNIHAWKVRMDCLPTRLNISRRGIDIPSILCPVCGSVTESSSHLFFDCLVAKDNFRKICRWWEVDFMEVHTFDEWVSWIVNLRIPIKHKRLLEGIVRGRKVSYYVEVTAFVEEGRMRNLTGVKSKELLIWVRISDIFVGDHNNGKITFGTSSGLSRTFLVSAFQ
ncbi:RNA-directed DNA polymerase, eukaryota, reverse transcriptase zinc-binding domain protein [Tanacetum coccineum]|uniref:RNA-directed DNA polymerase, eukaryota, reverse transcriptase zinc-binding domain protein n=1 Tax=Tanacetum coccineum TaxID=301880 RepID=A0ABQ5IJW0_9ASTR